MEAPNAKRPKPLLAAAVFVVAAAVIVFAGTRLLQPTGAGRPVIGPNAYRLAPPGNLPQAIPLRPGSDSVEPPAGWTKIPPRAEQPVRVFDRVPETVLEAGKDYAALIVTNRGSFIVDLHEARTPVTVNSFVWLALHRYYDGVSFHRVIPGFVAQGGDPTGSGGGGPGYQFGLEVQPDLRFNEAGVIGMARTNDPNSNGSQFYITLAATPNLNGQYTVFGKVISGLEVVEAIRARDPGAGGEADFMERVVVLTRG
jgi:cyclophilin family peptidyl-prolyl cis-trans isomerase